MSVYRAPLRTWAGVVHIHTTAYVYMENANICRCQMEIREALRPWFFSDMVGKLDTPVQLAE